MCIYICICTAGTVICRSDHQKEKCRGTARACGTKKGNGKEALSLAFVDICAGMLRGNVAIRVREAVCESDKLSRGDDNGL